jgi:hypothetical protein
MNKDVFEGKWKQMRGEIEAQMNEYEAKLKKSMPTP